MTTCQCTIQVRLRTRVSFSQGYFWGAGETSLPPARANLLNHNSIPIKIKNSRVDAGLKATARRCAQSAARRLRRLGSFLPVRASAAGAPSVGCDSAALIAYPVEPSPLFANEHIIGGALAISRAARFATRHNVSATFFSLSRLARANFPRRFDCCI